VTPSLAGDLLLLAVADRASYITRGPVAPALSGALLCQELFDGHPLGTFAPDRRSLVRLLEVGAQHAVAEVSGPLCSAGVLAPAEHRVLGLFPRRGFVVTAPSARLDAVARLRTALTPGTSPYAPTAALAVLCATSGIARVVAPPPRSRGQRRELAAHINGLRFVVGPDVSEVLLAVRELYRREGTNTASGSSDSSFVPASGNDGYGDSGGAGDSSGGGGGSDGGGGGGDGGGGGGD